MCAAAVGLSYTEWAESLFFEVSFIKKPPGISSKFCIRFSSNWLQHGSPKLGWVLIFPPAKGLKWKGQPKEITRNQPQTFIGKAWFISQLHIDRTDLKA